MTVYNIAEFGAKFCDSLQTEYIQKAIDTCYLNGGGEVIIPCGIYHSGGLRLRSNVTLHLKSGAILLGSKNPEDYFGYRSDTVEPVGEIDTSILRNSVYPFSRWNNALIRAFDAENVAVIGDEGSYIDGANCYDELGEEGYRGPHAISMHRCKNIVFKGYTIVNSANWSHAIFSSQNIKAENLTVCGGHDGFDIRTCDNVSIDNCKFFTGDDCIAGFDDYNVQIKNCFLNTACNALRLGGTNIFVQGCTSKSPANFGFRGDLTENQKKSCSDTDENCIHKTRNFFNYYCDFRAKIRYTPGNIVIKNCRIENPCQLFKLSFDGKYMWCINRSLTSIKFENCEISGVEKAINIYGDKNEPITFEMENVNISAKDGCEGIAFIEAVNYDNIIMKNVVAKNYDNPVVITKSSGIVTIDEASNIVNFAQIY